MGCNAFYIWYQEGAVGIDQPSLRSFPEHTRSLWFNSMKCPLGNATFPEHTHSLWLNSMKCSLGNATFPGHTRSLRFKTTLIIKVFRGIPVHFLRSMDYLCIWFSNERTSDMAGKIIDMSKIKQVLRLHLNECSNRGIAKSLSLNKSTVNDYIRKAHLDSHTIEELIKLDDPILESRFFAGSPAYTDERMDTFLDKLNYFKEQLEGKNHVTRLTLWEEYKSSHLNGYGKSQFYFHLKQNLVAMKPPVTVLSDHYEPAEKLFVDFAGDTLSYIDLETGERISVQVFVATMPYSDYAFVICVPSQRLEDFVYAMRMCLENLGGVPKIVVPDNLKSAVTRADRYEPDINKAFADMGNHYGFVVIPARSKKPQDKALVESQVKRVYHRVYAKLRNLQFYSLTDLNKAVQELVTNHNRTRMQQRPYTREERFFAKERESLGALPTQIYEIKNYAELQVLPTGRIYISKDKHYYSVPYELIGRRAIIIFTRSTVKIYVDNRCVATHLRTIGFGDTAVREHLAPNSLAYLDRSPEYFCGKAAKVSESLEILMRSLFENKCSSVVNEVYYRVCEKMLKLQRTTPEELFERACRVCYDNKLHKADSLQNVIAVLSKTTESEDVGYIEIKNRENSRGENFYQ